MEPANPASPHTDRMARRVARLRALLQLGGHMENGGRSLHLAGYRMDVGHLSDMDEAVWGQVQREVREVLGRAKDR